MIAQAQILLIFFIAIALFLPRSDGVAVLKSSCAMNMEFAATSKAGVDKIIQIQNESANFLLDRLIDLENAGLLEHESPKLLNVAIQSSDFQSMDNSSSISVISIVSLVYESTEQKQMLLEQTLDLAISKGPKVYNFSFTKEFVSFRFKPVEDDSQIIYVPSEDDVNGSVGSQIALIIVCSILSIMLVIVSGVLLFISGGWDSCKNKCINCLFEEVEDEFVVATKGNNQTSVHPTYDDEEEEEEEQSATTSPAPTTASGVLGAYGHPNQLAALGIKTPGRHDTGSMMTYDDDIGMTPMSAISNQQPLGITSMRKLPAPDTPDTQRGFAGLIKQRFASHSRN